MDVLVLGHLGSERMMLERFLADAGHEVAVCHDGSWGCVGMDGVCPLDERVIDVAVAAAEAGDRFDPHGIACAYRAGVPLVTVGATPNDPVLRYATAAVGRVDQELLDVLVDVRTSP